MKTNQYFSRKIKALIADKSAVPETPLLEELSDSEMTRIVGGSSGLAIDNETTTVDAYIYYKNLEAMHAGIQKDFTGIFK